MNKINWVIHSCFNQNNGLNKGEKHNFLKEVGIIFWGGEAVTLKINLKFEYAKVEGYVDCCV